MSTAYGVVTNGQLVVHKSKKSGDKPIVYADIPQIDENHIVWFTFVEQDEFISQVWHIAQNEYDNKDLYQNEIEDKAEAYDILMGVSE